MPKSTWPISLAPVLVFPLVTCCPPTIAQSEPLVELAFSGHLRNDGRLGGAAEMVEYAPDEGPAYGLGRAGAGVSFANSSRSGGTERTEAGGAVTYGSPALSGLRQLTLSAWFYPIETEGPARLLYLAGEWDLMIGGPQVSFKITSDGADHHFRMAEGAPQIAEHDWNFVAVVADIDAGTGAMYLAPGDGAPEEVARWDGLPAPDRGAGRLEIGNLAGIRPFKGLMDTVRIHDVALSESEVMALHEQDLRSARTLKDYVVPRPGENRAGFRYSDVCFSTRWARENALETIQAFKANRVVWVYTTGAEFVASVHQAGATVQGAINSVTRTDDLSAYAIDLDGTKLVAPWMVNFNKDDPVKWGCCNQPAYRDATIKQAKQTLDAGADWMQFDDWSLLASCHGWGGGCMCDRCMEGFRDYLAALPAAELQELGIDSTDGFDYREFLAEKHGIADAATYKEKRNSLPTTAYFADWQRKSVRSWFEHLRAVMDEHAGRTVPLSINSNLQDPSQDRNFIADLVDFFLGETWSSEFEDLAICARSAEGLGTHQIVSPFPHDVNETRIAMAATYALGEFYLVPWDVWMGPDKDRHFGTVEEYGDLYHFVRDNAELFDGFESPGMVGVIVNTDRYSRSRTQSIVRRLLRAQVPFSFVMTGHKYRDLPLQPERLAKFDVLIRLDELDTLPAADREVLDVVAEELAILSTREATESVLRRLSPIEVWGPEGIYALPRLKPDPDSRVIACHILNRLQAGGEKKVVPLRHLSIGLRGAVVLGSRVESATWHAPGRTPQPIEVDELPGLLRLVIPEVAEWGIARVEFAQ